MRPQCNAVKVYVRPLELEYTASVCQALRIGWKFRTDCAPQAMFPLNPDSVVGAPLSELVSRTTLHVGQSIPMVFIWWTLTLAHRWLDVHRPHMRSSNPRLGLQTSRFPVNPGAALAGVRIIGRSGNDQDTGALSQGYICRLHFSGVAVTHSGSSQQISLVNNCYDSGKNIHLIRQSASGI